VSRWFTRYAGWAPGQLQHECAGGVWFTAAAGRGVILASEHETGRVLWHKVLELMGGDYADLSQRVTSMLEPEGSPPPQGSDPEGA
jgi:putative transcriptional regulator